MTTPLRASPSCFPTRTRPGSEPRGRARVARPLSKDSHPMSSKHITYEQTNNEGAHAAKLRDFERSPKLSEIRAVYKSRKSVGERPRIRAAKDAESYLRAVWNHRTLELTEDFIV